ncbi:MAG: hypothetical protein AAB466_00820, partial [Verrucomicrobiota bacterium]
SLQSQEVSNNAPQLPCSDPVSMLNFQLNGLAQIYSKGQSIVADFPHGYLLERTCLTAIPR